MYDIVKELYYKRRDLVSDDYDESLNYISKILPIKIHKIKSGTPCWTWTIPEKWILEEAYVEADGKRLIDVKEHPLHVVSYSKAVNMSISKQDLMNHIYTNKDRPNAIPFEFKYYERDWGFCVQHEKLKEFIYDQYKVVIKSRFENGEMKIGELFLPGKSPETIVLVAHLCHPGMANDDLSGVAVLVNIANLLEKRKHRHFSYRILFLPETIGSIAYLSQNEDLISSMKFGIFFEMLGNDNVHALQFSRQGDTIIDMVARNIMKHSLSQFNEGPFREIISNDEMVFNGPGINIPMISISRWPYPEYHTSDDNMDIIKSEKLEESRDIIIKIIDSLEKNFIPKRKFKGPPFLSKYGLWVDWRENPKLNLMMEKLFLEFEGDKSIIEIAESLDLNFEDVYNYVNKFVEAELVEKL